MKSRVLRLVIAFHLDLLSSVHNEKRLSGWKGCFECKLLVFLTIHILRYASSGHYALQMGGTEHGDISLMWELPEYCSKICTLPALRKVVGPDKARKL